MSETIKPSATRSVTRPGNSFSPGRTSTVSRPTFSAPSRPSVERSNSSFVRPMSGEFRTQLKQAPGRVESRPTTLNTEKRVAPITPKTERGSQRFAKLGPTREFKYGRPADPMDRQIGRGEISRMVKIAEAPKPKPAAPETKTMALAKVEPKTIAERVVHKVRPEDITKIVPEKAVKPAELPQPTIDLTPIRGSSRYHGRSEVAARLNGIPRTPDRGVKAAPELAALSSGSRQTQRAEIIANLVKNQKVGLKDAMAAPVPAATRREVVAGLLRNQSGRLAELTASKPGSVAEQNIKTAAEAVKAPDRKPLNSEQSAKLAQLVTEAGTKPIDIQKAREIVSGPKAENNQQPKVESVADAVKLLEQAKTKANETQTKPATETKPKLQPHIEAAIQIVQQPEKVAIQPEKRDQAIELLRELAQTPEYATNQKLQEQLKQITKTEQEKAVEEAQVAKTAEQLLVAGISKEQVVTQLQQAMQSKLILVSEQIIIEIVTEVEQKIQLASEDIENGGDGEIDDQKEEVFDVNEERIRRLQELLVELDENVLEKRFETFFKALDKTWIQAIEEGWTEVKFEHIIANLPADEPGSEKSPIIRELERHDGSRVEATDEVKEAGSFDNLDIARQTLTNILLNHLPGRLTQQVTTQALTAAQVQEILQGGSYPTRMGQGNDDRQFVQNNAQFYSNAA